jgi:hypothetical protein
MWHRRLSNRHRLPWLPIGEPPLVASVGLLVLDIASHQLHPQSPLIELGRVRLVVIGGDRFRSRQLLKSRAKASLNLAASALAEALGQAGQQANAAGAEAVPTGARPAAVLGSPWSSITSVVAMPCTRTVPPACAPTFSMAP